MTASLYQSASLGSRPDSAAGSSAGVLSGADDLSITADFVSFIYLRRPFGGCPSVQRLKIVVEILLVAHAPPQQKHMRGCALWIEHDVVEPAAPDITLLAQQIMHLGRLLGIERKGTDVPAHPAPC